MSIDSSELQKDCNLNILWRIIKKTENQSFQSFLVRVSRFELEASWTPFKRDTKLRHTRIFCSAPQRLSILAHLDKKSKHYFQKFQKFFRGRLCPRNYLFSPFAVDYFSDVPEGNNLLFGLFFLVSRLSDRGCNQKHPCKTGESTKGI